MTPIRKQFNHNTWKSEYVSTDKPEVLIVSEGHDQVEQHKPKQKIALNNKERTEQELKEQNKNFLVDAPQEVVTTQEGTLIQNFEVDFVEEKEIRMIGGVKGLQALKQQR